MLVAQALLLLWDVGNVMSWVDPKLRDTPWAGGCTPAQLSHVWHLGNLQSQSPRVHPLTRDCPAHASPGTPWWDHGQA